MPRFLNPYNFVRPLDKTPQIERLEQKYQDSPEHLTADEAKQLLLWRCPPPPHDRFTGLSGKITCRMVAKTPIFVSDGEGVQEDENGHRTFRFFKVDGEDVIPASSLRGAIRSVFESVTNSCWTVFNDQTMSYRLIPNDALGLVPGLLHYEVEKQKWALTLLNGRSIIDTQNNFKPKLRPDEGRIPEMYAAWLPMYYDQPHRNINLRGLQHGDYCFAVLSRQEYHDRRGNLRFYYQRVEAVAEDSHDPELLTIKDETGGFITDGFLCITGYGEKNINRKHDERFFFLRSEKQYTTYVDDCLIEDYNYSLLEARDFHKKSRTTDVKSRHLLATQEEELIPVKPDDRHQRNYIIYVKIKNMGKTSLEVEYIAPVSIPRVLEKRSFYDVMRDVGYDCLLPATNYDELSLADRVFGWVSQDANNDDFGDRVAYKGRVRVSHACPDGNVERLEDMRLTILSAPKPTTTRFYVKPREDLNRGVNASNQTNTRWQNFTDEKLRYSKPVNKLRGRKIYRHHKRFNRDEATSTTQSNQNRTIVGTHAEGTEYIFTIHFENLQSVELGTLLWTLQLNDNWQGYHRIGYGKPLGFGSTTIKLEKTEFHDSQRYMGNTDPVTIDTDACIQAFKDAIRALYGKPFDQLENIQDLKALLSEPPLEVIHYPRSSHKDTAGDKNYEWFMNNKRHNRNPNQRGPNVVLPYASEDIEGLPYIQRQGHDITVDW